MSRTPLIRSLLVAAVISVAYFALGTYVLLQEQQRWRGQMHVQLQEVTDSFASAVERSVNRALAVIATMESYIRHHQGRIEDFDSHSADMLSSVSVISGLQLAPGGVTRHVFPQEGFEFLLGRRLVDEEVAGEAARRAMLNHEVTLSRPLTLQNGDLVVYGHAPIYLPDLVGDELFWGFSSVILKVEDLVAEANLASLWEAGYLYQLHLDESGPSAGDPRPMFPQETARQTLRVPGAHWELRLAPAKPWNHPPTFFVYLALLLSTTVLVAYVAFTLIWQPIHLRQEVARSGQALREANERYLAVFNGVREVIFQLGLRGELRLLNPAWEEITGFSVSASAGRPLAEFLHPEDLDDCQEMVNAAIAHTEEHQAGELRLRGRGNEVRWVEVEMHAIPDEQGGIAGVAGSMRDVTERKRADQLIHYQAHFDALTNLPNRKLFLDRFGRAIETSLRNERRLALMFVDLDRFKWINDSLGHAAGDVLLKEVAMRLSACVRKADTVARFGGDEFIVLLAEIGAAIDAEVVARKILVELNRPFLLNGHEETISGSIGITVCPDDGRDITTLMNNADNVMYHVKEAGRNDFQFFTAAMNQALQERHRMASALRQALAARELRLEYQTVVALQGRQVIGIEALLRWHSEEFGVVQPDRVIALAEDTQLIGPLGGWIIEQACRDFLAARERLPRLEFVTVNVSDRQFRAHGLAELPAILARHGMQPAQFCIDITESLVTEGREEVWSDLDAFRQLGVRIMLDDFGTGLSSLNHLKRLAPSAVKLQSDYLAGIVPEASAAAMIGSVIAMAHSMGMRVVGEGVEEARQAEMLELLGCDYAQGYLFERPLPIAGLLQQCADSHRGSEAGGRAG